MAISWPVTVNQDVVRPGYTEKPKDNVSLFEPDAGPAIGHSRTITDTEIVGPFEQYFTPTEYAAFKEWRRVDLKNGTLSFERLHPTEGVLCTFVFAPDGFQLVELLPVERRVKITLQRIA
ncbi:MAG: hypothetical protein Q8M03_06995 [Legionella sp.]|nr:hypothetical protein [Legionella sp.]